MGNPNPMQVEGFFDSSTSTVSYLVLDRSTMQCALIDSVLDYDPKAGRTHTASADKLVARVRDLGVRVVWFLVLLVHADHLSAAPYLKEKLGGRLGIGKDIVTVQNVFGKLFNAGAEFARDGSQFDHLFSDGEAYARPYAGLHDLCHQRRKPNGGFRRRYAVHAGLWHCAL